MSDLIWLEPDQPFPHPNNAFTDPNGLLAAGYDLSPQRVVDAYRQGIFPWFSEDQPVLWWSPNPRCIIYPNEVHISKSLQKHIRKTPFSISFDREFSKVITECARLDSETGTWITPEMQMVYEALHTQGFAHSVEVWLDNELIGGLYGIAMGKIFFGESMFSKATNASKIAFCALCKQLQRWQYQLIDCQVENPHLISLGAKTIDRQFFLTELHTALALPRGDHPWTFDDHLLN